MRQEPVIGRQLFDVVTSGMYDNPLMVYREYIQNSVDSIDLAVAECIGTHNAYKIEINVSGCDRTITIYDNGKGLNNVEAHVILRSLGCSPKEGRDDQRGFRGIGRLGGLAYCDQLIFETRSHFKEQVAVVTWDRQIFDKLASSSSFVSLAEAIQIVSKEELRPAGPDEAEHFFKVTMKHVRRFHSDILMNVKSINNYISQVAPVPYNHDLFSFSGLIEEKVSVTSDYKTYNIYLNQTLITRPYIDSFQISTNTTERIKDLEFFNFKGSNGQDIATGWYAKTSFSASLPLSLNCRGIRVRQGNIEVGNECFLDSMFVERRFSSWQIGEIHILNNSLKANARRDSFEHTIEFEKFLEQASLLGRHLSTQCRKASNARTTRIRIEDTLTKVNQLLASGMTFINEEHFSKAFAEAKTSLQQIENLVEEGTSDSYKKQCIEMYKMLDNNTYKPVFLENSLDGRRLKGFNNKALLTHISKTIVDSYDRCSTAEEMLQKVFSPFLKSKVNF